MFPQISILFEEAMARAERRRLEPHALLTGHEEPAPLKHGGVRMAEGAGEAKLHQHELHAVF